MKIQKKGRGAVVTFTESDAHYLAMIIGYARNGDLSPDGTPGGERRGRKMLFELTAVAAALDANADTHIFSLDRDRITDGERKTYDAIRRVFDPGYGTADGE